VNTAQPIAVTEAALRAGRLLGRGGQGRVVEVLDCAGWPREEPLVAKWYLPSVALDAGSLTRLVAWRRSLDEFTRSIVDSMACWPRAVLLRGGRAAGVLLPRVPPRFSAPMTLPSGSTRQVLMELQYLIASPGQLVRRDLPDVGVVDRLRVLSRFVAAVTVLHGHGIVLGDLSVKNMLWSVVDSPVVYLLCRNRTRRGGTTLPFPAPRTSSPTATSSRWRSFGCSPATSTPGTRNGPGRRSAAGSFRCCGPG
jgi:DNA-binding helix-hairpin-helix protein with protein kinase domain